MSDIRSINPNQVREFPKEAELYDRIKLTIDDYVGELSVVAVIGILNLMAHDICSNEEDW